MLVVAGAGSGASGRVQQHGHPFGYLRGLSVWLEREGTHGAMLSMTRAKCEGPCVTGSTWQSAGLFLTLGLLKIAHSCLRRLRWPGRAFALGGIIPVQGVGIRVFPTRFAVTPPPRWRYRSTRS
jgi:hypothetical protein